VLKRRTFFQGRAIRGEGVADVSWFAPDGTEMADGDFDKPAAVMGCRLAGDLIEETDEYGEPVRGDTLLILFNPTPTPTDFSLPTTNENHLWHLEFDTSDDSRRSDPLYGRTAYPLADRSVAVFRARG
jgi:glycogen operon protein